MPYVERFSGETDAQFIKRLCAPVVDKERRREIQRNWYAKHREELCAKDKEERQRKKQTNS
jgi:hypothetical protein